ncbi:VOC family protein [Rhodoferax sp. GW822-FHT02A01]|uniref:VOC family protein n=1 Tax=Rhodoferax sp. GW822-FHT02A01 TaxID=3141537 RepID=UPI00315D4D23
MAQPKLFNDAHHVCIIVRDIEKATKYYESLGIGPWKDFPSLEPYLGHLDEDGKSAYMSLHYRFANLNNIQLQLCQPKEGKSPQWKFLLEKGEGVYHIGFSVEDLDASEKVAQEIGLEVRAHGRRADGAGFTYFETENEGAGVTLEIRAAGLS